MLSPPHGARLTVQAAPSTIQATAMGWMPLMLILDLDWVGPCKVTGDVLHPLSWGTPEPPARWWQGSGTSFGCLPVIKLGEMREQVLCSQEGGAVWQGGHCGEAELLRSELPVLIPPVALPEPAVLNLEGQRNFSATELRKRWVLGENNFSVLPAFLLVSQGAPFLWLFVLKLFDFAMWIGT